MADKKTVPNLDVDEEVERIIGELDDDKSYADNTDVEDEPEVDDEDEIDNEPEDEAEIDSEAEDEPDEEPDDEPEEQPVKSGKRPVTKEQRKIIEDKRRIKGLEAEVARLRQESEAQKRSVSVTEKAKTYLDQGFDEDEAKRRASDDIRNEEILDRLEMAEFKAENQVILSKYPGADVRKVIATMRASGASVDTVCKLLYRTTAVMETDSEKREREAVIRSSKKASAANPTGAKRAETTSRLSKEEVAHKQTIESFIGRKLTSEEYIRYHKR